MIATDSFKQALGLGVHAVGVLVVLVAHDMHGDGIVWPSIRRIGQETGKSPEWVLAGLRELEQAGIISWDGARGVRGGRVTVWRITEIAGAEAVAKRSPSARQVARQGLGK